MSYEPDMPVSSTAVAREKVNLPGIFLMIVGIINILAALYFTFSGAMAVMAPKQAAQGMDPGSKKQLEEMGWSQEMVMQKTGVGFVIVSVLGLIAGAITILAGVKMRSLQSRGLVVFGSVLTMIPCISPLGCCLLGQAVGIWALVALNNPEVKAAFR